MSKDSIPETPQAMTVDQLRKQMREIDRASQENFDRIETLCVIVKRSINKCETAELETVFDMIRDAATLGSNMINGMAQECGANYRAERWVPATGGYEHA
ncbi:MAG: hypothetical protein KDG52_21750 [Rhodocyclaceae bacterium]|nr:hypothetical protein [Rhodocyclaceae bacterium]